MKFLFVTAAAILALPSGVLAAENLPQFKAEGCRAVEENKSTGRDAQTCFRDEQIAKESLQQNWSSYDPTQKNHCRLLMKAGGMPSYVELLTCIEMKSEPTTTATVTTKKKKKRRHRLRRC
jgi:hypothetical protein